MQAANLWSVADWQQKLEQLQPSKIELGLARVSAVAERLGLTGANALAGSVITVGGTNGKGSTVCFLEHLLLNCGMRVGAYTSPHILRFNERIRIGGELVSDESLCEAFSAVEAARQTTSLTYFEFTTLAAMHLFRREALDFALLEVGLGGRLDAVNIIDTNLAVITSIGLDHQEWLGDTRELIAGEKAGIMRAGVPVLCGDQDPPATLLEHAQDLKADLQLFGKDFGFRTRDGDSWDFWSRERTTDLQGLPLPKLPLTSGVLALQVLQRCGVEVTEEKVKKTLQDAELPGRFQQLSVPAVDGSTIHYVLDVAHNPQAMEYLVEKLQDQCLQGRVIAICAILADKDADTIVRLMSNTVAEWFLPSIETERALAPAVLCKLVEQVSEAPATTTQNMQEAISRASQVAGPLDVVLIFGSFYTVAESLQIIGGA